MSFDLNFNLNLLMSTTASSTGPPNTVGERQPLLGSRTGSIHADPETAVPADESEDAIIVAKKVDHWRIIWYLVFATFGGILLAGVIKGFLENGDIKVRVVVVLVIFFSADRHPLSDP